MSLTPDQLAKSGTEHAHQVALLAYINVAHRQGFYTADLWADGAKLDQIATLGVRIPALEWLHAVHNQGHGDAIRGARARAEGVRKGVADLFLPWPLLGFAGLYIEMKKPTEKPKSTTAKGGLSEEQLEFAVYVQRVGYQWRVCYGWREAVDAIKDYLGYKPQE